MVVAKYRPAAFFAVLLSLGFAEACVSGGTDEVGNNAPECYGNQECTAGHECSAGICVPFNGCGNGCRNNEDCLDNVCRLKCTQASDCEDQGLLCGTDTKHCKPKPNPTRSQTMTQSGSGGTSSGTGGSGSAAGRSAGGSSGSGMGAAGMSTGAGGAPVAAGGAPTAGGSSAPTAGSGS
jgi:hypothetical protein